jgi:hypothetical protein
VCGGPRAKAPPPSGSSAARIAARWASAVSAAVGVGLGRRSGCSGRAGGGGAGAGVLEGRAAVVEAVEAEAGGAFSLSEASDSSSGWVAVACEAVGDC